MASADSSALVLMDFDLLASPICHTKIVHSFPPVERLFAEMRQPLFAVFLFDLFPCSFVA